ncbi:hypothetical protein DO71_5336 [Burkholderia pseudomallei]|uniref:hypothetical protein n=1 Tax=Burkholderia pseudomallei TaxID=28450 RepID=UPI00050DDDA4|nr:hypothetical protein DO71_5336 [Burkholderia pseudomallei]
MKDRIEIDSREKKSAKKRVAFRSIFSAEGAAGRIGGVARTGGGRCAASDPGYAGRACRSAAFSPRWRGLPGALADARPCATNRMDHSIRDRAPKYPQIFPNFL